MKTIWKYPVALADRSTLDIPGGGDILTVQMQGPEPCLWVLVDTDQPTFTRRFRLFGTGYNIDAFLKLDYIASFQPTRSLVFHLFEEKEPRS